ncbi:hypothetical protein [Metasolibacillus sp.]|uniref:hypothetical protein n=1 Tax=Metasolibacillus sp. TaxID=2703680 RepID=UPI0025D63BCA|nr:hypothetical protein [Metasolibacillus sp.]MCT6922772.1 hypothetical protein [Metasolibacillus sp.]MCT6938889.1 hypothetical protein [Metasolibacillus sp.]
MKIELKDALEKLLVEYNSNYTENHLRIVEMVLQIENIAALNFLYCLSKDFLHEEKRQPN